MIEQVKGFAATVGLVGAALGAVGAEVQGMSLTATAAIAIVSGVVSATAAVVGTRSSARGAHRRVTELEHRTTEALRIEREDRRSADDALADRLSRIDAHLEEAGKTMTGVHTLLARMEEREKFREQLRHAGHGTRETDR